MIVDNRQIIKIYRKLLYKNNIAPINIGLSRLDSMFNLSLQSIDNPLINFSEVSSDILDNHLLFINDPINFLQHVDKNFYQHPILFFHDDNILKMKKEDIHLLRSDINKYTKYSFNERLSSIIQDIKYIPYGFKEPNQHIINNKTNSILFIGQQRNIDQIIFGQIRSKYPDAEFIDDMTSDNQKLAFEKYIVCINMKSRYDTLFAAANGCITVSLSDEPDIPNHYKIINITDILDCLNTIQQTYDKAYHIQNSNNIISKYPYEIFKDKINFIITQEIDKHKII